MKEHEYDTLLNIRTGGKHNGFLRDSDYHPYEPTPYQALEILFDNYEVKRTDRIVDFGCGKGRLVFYAHHRFLASAAGVEMNEALYREAMKNRQSYAKKHPVAARDIQFFHCRAEEYGIEPADNRFYFFNPFSVRIFMKIIGNILRSYERAPRELELVLYYPSEAYLFFLQNRTPFQLIDEIALTELYGNHPYERFLIYRLGPS